MQYRVTGINRETGSRMLLEVEAASKAAAEKKASSAGMMVHHVDLIGRGPGEDAGARAGRHRSHRRWVRIVIEVIVIGAVVAVVWHYWPEIRRLL